MSTTSSSTAPRCNRRAGGDPRHVIDMAGQLHRLIFLLLLCLINRAGLAADENRPNILLIMADDLGYNDLHIYNQNPLARTPIST